MLCFVYLNAGIAEAKKKKRVGDAERPTCFTH